MPVKEGAAGAIRRPLFYRPAFQGLWLARNKPFRVNVPSETDSSE